MCVCYIYIYTYTGWGRCIKEVDKDVLYDVISLISLLLLPHPVYTGTHIILDKIDRNPSVGNCWNITTIHHFIM